MPPTAVIVLLTSRFALLRSAMRTLRADAAYCGVFTWRIACAMGGVPPPHTPLTSWRRSRACGVVCVASMLRPTGLCNDARSRLVPPTAAILRGALRALGGRPFGLETCSQHVSLTSSPPRFASPSLRGAAVAAMYISAQGCRASRVGLLDLMPVSH